MSPAERESIRAAARRAAVDAPPLSEDQLRMLRHDNCPIFHRQADKAAS